jgi:hypothetical protein
MKSKLLVVADSTYATPIGKLLPPIGGILVANRKALNQSKKLGSANVRPGSCVTSIAMSTGDAQLYER